MPKPIDTSTQVLIGSTTGSPIFSPEAGAETGAERILGATAGAALSPRSTNPTEIELGTTGAGAPKNVGG
jgi:hypothetical protein